MKTNSQTYRKNHLLLDSSANVAVIAAVVLVLGSVMANSFNQTPASANQMASRTTHTTRVVADTSYTNAADTNATKTPARVAVAYRANSSLVAAR